MSEFCVHEDKKDGTCELGGVCDVSHITSDPLDFCSSWEQKNQSTSGKQALEGVEG